jgi:hypothetical protein
MSAQSIQPAFTTFQDIDGQPLENGYIYVGTAGSPAATNQITVYSDAALSTVLTQPIRTRGGYPVVAGVPVAIYTGADDFSIAVNDKNNSTIVSALNKTQFLSSSSINYTSSGTGGVERTLSSKLGDSCHVLDFGAVGDGVADDSAAIQAAFTACGQVDMGGSYSYKISSTVAIPSFRDIYIGNSSIVADTGVTPVFTFGTSVTAGTSLSITSKGGVVSGTASSFLYLEGVNDFPSSPSNFTKAIRLSGLDVSSATITNFIDMKTAVRAVFIDSCQTFTPNGIISDGKSIEVKIDNSIFFGATGAVGTAGIKLSSALAGSLCNEGWHVNNCTVDGFDHAFDITDFFVFCIGGCWIDGVTGAIVIRDPVSTPFARELNITGNVIRGPIAYEAFTSGINSYGMISSNQIQSGIVVGGNQSGLNIVGNSFESGPGGAGVVISDNVSNLVCDSNSFDATYAGGVIMSGVNGSGIVVRNISYKGTGSSVYTTRPVLLDGIDIGDGTSAVEIQTYAEITATTYAVAATMASITGSWAKGQTGTINCNFSFTGGTASTQRFDVTAPAGMVLPNGAGWSATYNYTKFADGTLSFSIPFYCTADIVSQNLTLTNGAGTTVTVDSHCWFGFTRA